VEPRTFDAIAQKLSRLLSRRSLVGGSLGASVLATVGLDNDASAKNKKVRGKGKSPDVRTEDCIKTGKRCPAKRVGSKHKHGKLGCDRCCQGRSVTITNNKGKKVNKCACKPDGDACSPDRSQDCCNGVCQGGTCGTKPSPPPPPTPCNPPSITCSGQCVNPLTDPLNCGECRRICPPGTVCNNGLACQGAQCLPVTETENCVATDPQGGLTLRSGPQCSADPATAYGAFAFGLPAGTLFSQVNGVQWFYDYAVGNCGGGSPRIVFIIGGEFLSANIPPSQCPDPDQVGSTGQLVGNNEPLVWAGQTDPTITTYSAALTKYGAMSIDSVFMVADEPSGQVVTVEPCVTVI